MNNQIKSNQLSEKAKGKLEQKQYTSPQGFTPDFEWVYFIVY
jgi:hypothetical protein